MSDTRSSAWARPAALAEFRTRQRNRFDLTCESLECRQLLSTAVIPGTDLSQITALPNLQVLPLVTTGPTGLSPQQIAGAYGVNQITFSGGKVVGNGAGQTIAIVTAYNDPNITLDLASFDKQYGLAAPPSFTVKNLGGTTTDAGWALETSLDVEWAHALAPAAKILLVEAGSASLADLFNAVSYASTQSGVSVVSMSWGTTEFWGQSSYDSLFTTPTGHSGVTYVAASGDAGAWYGPMYPSVSPNVLAVGGTSLTVSGNNYGSESGWSGSTGGFSGLDSYWQFYEPQPSYQNTALQAVGLSYGVRTTPDVSFNADPNSGVSVYDSVAYSGQSGWFQVGGTSAATPAWAGLIAIANQGLATAGKPVLSGTQAQSDLYKLPSSDFHDITSGYNGYSATPGYDLVTGLGSPRAELVVAGILSESGVSQTLAPAQIVSATTTTTTSSQSHRFDQVATSTSGTAVGAGALTSMVTVSNPAGSHLAMQALTSSANAAQAQPTVPSVIASTLGSLSPAPTSLPGQSLPEERQASPQHTSIDEQAESTAVVDEAAAVKVKTPVPNESPAPVPQDAPTPVKDDATAPAAAPAMGLPTDDPPVDGPGAAAALVDQPTVSLSAAAGTAVLVAGGYRLILGRSDRIRRHWSPVRFR